MTAIFNQFDWGTEEIEGHVDLRLEEEEAKMLRQLGLSCWEN